MKIYLIDDLGENGEYAGFLNTYKDILPPFSIRIFTYYDALRAAISDDAPDLVLADMRFDTTPVDQLYGDIKGLAQTEAFCGNTARAEAQVRGMQGLLICRALRQSGFSKPIILFASIAPNIAAHVKQTLAPIHIIEGLILRDVKSALESIQP